MSILLTTTMFVTGFIIKDCVAGDNIPEPSQTVLISLTISIFVFVISKISDIFMLYRKYIKIEGQYTSYSYITDNSEDSNKELYYQLNDHKNDSIAKLEYKGDKNFTINISAGGYTWVGDFVIQSDNRAEIAWWYISPDIMKNTVGYKTAVVKVDGDEVNIVIFGTDKSRFGRELLIKNPKN